MPQKRPDRLGGFSESERIPVRRNSEIPDESGHFAKPVDNLQEVTHRRARDVLFPKDHKLDLHGFLLREALWELEEFIDASNTWKRGRVLIITGRGVHSKNGKAVLKNGVRERLQLLKNQKKIVSFQLTPREGAFFVTLQSFFDQKRHRKKRR